MKLKLLLVVAFCVVNTESYEIWFPDILGHFSNKTSRFTQYLKQQTQNFREQYIYNLGKKLAAHFNNVSAVEVGDQNKIKQRQINVRAKRREKNFILKPKPTLLELPTLPKPKPHDFTSAATSCSDDDPMIHMSTPQLIASSGYPAESHTIVTDDGYILTIHRIPFHKNGTVEDPRRTVLLHHGLFGSSADWVIAGPEKSLAYILSDAGYDVWMANCRGNTYSKSHISRSVDSYAFWNFTFHDISQHDLPAIIEYITKIKPMDVKINYIGHSMGTTVLFALLSTKTQYNKVLRAGYALAPVAYMSVIKSPLKILAKFANNINYLMKLLGENEFLPQNAILRWLSMHFCEINHYERILCENAMFVFCGHDPKQFNQSLLPVILSHNPAGASTKTLVHYAQIIHNDGQFQQYDYGPVGNIAQYGSATPPVYEVHKITLPVALLSAENDWLSGETDVTNLYLQLANPIEHYIVPFKEFNHIDFLWGIDAPKLVYSKLLQLLEDGISSYTYFNPDLVDSNELDVNL